MIAISNGLELRVAAIREYVTIFEVLDRFGVEVTPETQQMRCPFHADNSPSARVYAEQNKIYCFTCQRGWDVIDAVQQQFRLTFADAVVWLEQEFSVPGGTQSVGGAIRTKLSARAAPDLKAVAEMVEASLRSRRHAIGYERYTRCLMALDLTLWEATEQHTLKPDEIQQRMGRILQASQP